MPAPPTAITQPSTTVSSFAPLAYIYSLLGATMSLIIAILFTFKSALASVFVTSSTINLLILF